MRQENRNPSIRTLLLLPFVLLICTTAIASYFANRNLLLVAFLLIGFSAFLASFRLPVADKEWFFEVAVWAISMSLLLAKTLVSRDLAGYDVHQEYNVFEQVFADGTWRVESYVQYNTALSVSILPSMFSTVSGIEGIQVFKYVYPALYSIFPVVLYKVYGKILDPASSFLSIFFLMSYPSFYEEMTSLGRQEIAELLLVLLLLVFFSPKMNSKRAGRVLVILLTIGVVTAHYSIAYIYLFFLGCSLVISHARRKLVALDNATTIGISAVVVISWGLYVASGYTMILLGKFVVLVAKAVVLDFYNPSLRPTEFLQAFGVLSATPGLLHGMNRAIQYLVQLTLLLGFLVLCFRKQKTEPEKKMLPLMMSAIVMLGFAVVLPYFAGGLNLSRLYHILLLFLSPCLIYGVKWINSVIGNLYARLHINPNRFHVPFCRKTILAGTILFSYFLFTSGWVWAVSMDNPTSFILDWNRMKNSYDNNLKVSYFNEYTAAQDVIAARWLRSHLPIGSIVCSDYTSRYHVLNSYGGFSREWPTLPSECNIASSYVYMGVMNSLYGVGTKSSRYLRWPISDISDGLVSKNRIYSGDSTIYA